MATHVARDLYLDLLVKCLSNLIYGPPPSDPWNDGLFRPDAKPGRDRHSPAHTMVGILRLRNVRELAQRALDLGVSGDFIETGVWRGGCCILLRGVLAANEVTDRKVYVADSFEGVPPPKSYLYPQDTGDTLHTVPELAVSMEEVKANFGRYELLDDQVVFVKGFFSDTLPKLHAGPFALMRLDGDLYEIHIRRAGLPIPKTIAGRLRYHRRLRRHCPVPPSCDRLPCAIQDRCGPA